MKKLNDLDHFLRVGKLYFIWESAETWDATIESTGHGLSRGVAYKTEQPTLTDAI